MARGINKVVLVGNVVRDPDMRYKPDGTAVARITLATNESWKDTESGERKERAEYHNVVLFGRTAEVAGEYLRTGSLIYVEGQLRTSKWQDKNGIDRWTTEIRGREMQMLVATPKSANQAAATTVQESPATATKPKKPTPAKAAPAPVVADDFDDDIPFVLSDYAGQSIQNDAAKLLRRSHDWPVVW